MRSVAATPTFVLILGVALTACGPGDGTSKSTAGASSTGAPSVTTTDSPPTPMGTAGATDFTTTIAEDDDISDGCGGFYGGCADDFFPMDTECDIWGQDCFLGEKCNAWANDGGDAWNATKCVPIAATPGSAGEACTVEGSGVSGYDSCDLGSMCFYVDPSTLEGICVARCTGSSDAPACPETQVCVIANEGVLALCHEACTPDGGECEKDETCSVEGKVPHCVPAAAPMPGDYGTSCVDIATCNEGLDCVSPEHVPGCDSEACCTTQCDPTAKNTCPDAAMGQTCVPYEGSPTLGRCAIAGR